MNTRTMLLEQAAGQTGKPLARRQLWIRCGAVAAQTALLAIEIDQPGQMLVLCLMSGMIVAFALSSMISLQLLRRAGEADDRAGFRHVLADLAVLTYLLAISGGPANPFHDAFFLPVAVAAASMAARYAWWVAGTSLVGYTVTQFANVPLLVAEGPFEGSRDAAEWMTHALLTVLATHFLAHVRKHLNLRERQLSEVREAAARAECAVAVGSIAAGAAHELSTPVTTIAAALDSLRHSRRDDVELMRGLDTIAAGVNECRRALEVLRQTRGPWTPSSQPVELGQFVSDIVNRFFAMHPGVPLTRCFDSPAPTPLIRDDLALQQAVMNLLNNAAHASPSGVSLRVSWDDEELSFQVTDQGPGVPEELLSKLGSIIVSGRPGGQGLGLFLTQVTSQRLGGRFQISNGKTAGAVAVITLPLLLLRAKPANDAV